MRFQLHFLIYVYIRALPYSILASHKSANVHIFLQYHACVSTPFEQFCHIYSLYEMQSNFLYYTPYKGVTYQFTSFVNIVLDIVSLYGLFLGTTYQRLGTSFQITFSHPSPCVVLILLLHISR